MKKTLLVFLVFFGFLCAGQIFAQDSFHPQALELFRSSLENLMTGDYEQAIVDSTGVLRFEPDSSVTLTVRARAYYETGNFERAINDATQAIRHDRNNISAYNIRANSYVKRGDFNRAIGDWNAVLRINPDNVDAVQNRDRARQQLREQ